MGWHRGCAGPSLFGKAASYYFAVGGTLPTPLRFGFMDLGTKSQLIQRLQQLTGKVLIRKGLALLDGLLTMIPRCARKL
jgi:hypothetical protein